MVYLTNRKPDRAIAALRSTRIADLSGELRQQRLLLEARAQSDVGRRDLALDIISNISGREAIRLRSDIYWASRRWREASEQIELYYADRWRDFKPLNPLEKGDEIRAVIGYALAEDAIGPARFREKYAPLMIADADRSAFEAASRPAAANSAEFAEIARMAASVDTLDGFLREMKTRFPDASARAPAAARNREGRSVPDRLAAGDYRIEAGRGGKVAAASASVIATSKATSDPGHLMQSAKAGSRELHSITSVAIARRAGGTVRPSSLAVVRLITSSKMVVCSTGRSPGFEPRNSLSTYSAARTKLRFGSSPYVRRKPFLANIG
jgi:hypothetical protein